MLTVLITLVALPYVLGRRLADWLTPAPLALPPAADPGPLAALTVAELRTLAAQSRRFSRRFYTYGRRADLLAALAAL